MRLIAPRPFFGVSGVWDDVNWEERERPETIDEAMEWKRLAHHRAKEVYRLFSKEECLGLFEFERGRFFPKEGREAAYAWLKRWLTGDGQ